MRAVEDAVRLGYSFPVAACSAVKVWHTCSLIASHDKEVTGLFAAASEIQCGCITKLFWGIDRLACAVGGNVPRKLNLPVLFLVEKHVSTCKCELRLESQLNQLNPDLLSLDKAPLHTLGREKAMQLGIIGSKQRNSRLGSSYYNLTSTGVADFHFAIYSGAQVFYQSLLEYHLAKTAE